MGFNSGFKGLKIVTRIVGSNPSVGIDVCLLLVLCFSVEVFVSGWSLVQRSLAEYGVSNECDRDASYEESMTLSRAEAPAYWTNIL